MRIVSVAVVILVAGAAFASVAHAQANPAAAELDDLAWLVGSWSGEGLGGEIEEYWSAASGGTMMGAFRLVVDDELGVIEYLMITAEEGRISYRFKHFNGDYSTWEDDRPLEFTLVEISDREAVFHSEVPEQDSPRRITYRLTETGDLVVVVASSDAQGALAESFEIRYARR